MPKAGLDKPIGRLAFLHDKSLRLAEESRLALEQPDIMALDLMQMREQRLGEFVSPFEAEKAGELARAPGSDGSVWVCSSAIICRRCSTRRRKS